MQCMRFPFSIIISIKLINSSTEWEIQILDSILVNRATKNELYDLYNKDLGAIVWDST